MAKGFGLVFGGFVFLQDRPNLRILASVLGGGPDGYRVGCVVAINSKVPQGLLVLCTYSCFCTGRSVSLIIYRRQLRPRLAVHTSLDLWDN